MERHNEAVGNRNPAVDAFMEELEHPLKGQIAELRELILGSGPGVTEAIKWKAPTFNDRATFHLRSTGQVQMVLHRGPKVKDATDFGFEDETGWLTWPATDRAVMTVPDGADLGVAADLVGRWIRATE